MLKYLCLFVCLVATATASYGRHYGAPVGARVYQTQPELTVSAVVPTGYGLKEVPVSAVYTNGGYGRSSYGGYAPAVDRHALALAKLSLAAPPAGAPLVWREPRTYARPVYAPSYVQPRTSYAHGDGVQGASGAAAAASVADKKGYRNNAY